MTLLNHIMQLSNVVLDNDGKFLFLGIPKVGLHSVYNGLLRSRAMSNRGDGDLWIHRMATINIDTIFKFTIVRNPWDRVVSTFHALQQKLGKPHISQKETFRHFVKTVFQKYGVLFDGRFEFQYPKFYFKGAIFTDFIARLESIEKDWIKIATVIECSSGFPHVYRSEHGYYGRYYDKECEEIVRRIYRKDIELLGYDFNENTSY